MHASLLNAQCFVHCVSLNGDGTGDPVTDPFDTHKPVWIHLDYSHNDCADVLRQLGLDDYVIESLVRTNTRPQTLAEKNGFVIFLRAVNLNPGDDPYDMVSQRMWFEKDRLITIRQRRVFSIQDIRGELEAGKGPVGVGDLFMTILERLADRISEYVDDIEERVGEFEDTVETSNSNEVRVAVSPLRRQSATVSRFIVCGPGYYNPSIKTDIPGTRQECHNFKHCALPAKPS